MKRVKEQREISRNTDRKGDNTENQFTYRLN